MCEKRTRKIKKGPQMTGVREARRVQRLNWLTALRNRHNSAVAAAAARTAIQAHKTAQNRVLLELAWKLLALMQKNKLIQQKIIDLQKETSEFFASMSNNPENRGRYVEQMQVLDDQGKIIDAMNRPIKVEPEV